MGEDEDENDTDETESNSVSNSSVDDSCSPLWYQYGYKGSSTSSSANNQGNSARDLSRTGSWLSFTNSPSSSENNNSAKRPTDYTTEEMLLSDTEATLESDLSIQRQVWIVTTAALPWMTGTAVNPLLRAAYFAQIQETQVHLVIPWLGDPSDRVELYGEEWENANANDQEKYIQNWLETNVTNYSSESVQIHWYRARYHSKLGSIFSMEDVCQRLDPNDDAICILEEPEHLNYYRGGHWRVKFGHVCGVIHTNYCQYAEQKSTLAAPLIGAVSAWMVRAYCDKVIQLSSTLPAYAPEKEVVCNVHGVREEFFQRHYYTTTASTDDQTATQIYFLGKLLWAKGLDKLLELQQYCKRQTGQYFAMDIYGSGPEQDEIAQAFRSGCFSSRLRRGGSSMSNSSISSSSNNNRSYSEMAAAYWRGNSELKEESAAAEPLPVTFPGRVDHAALDQQREGGGCYKIFVNPSVSEVLCTVTAEAIAMGKFVIIPNHPSNTFFQQFPNCLLYKDDDEFLLQLDFAVSHDPQPLSEESRAALTWQGATERLVQAVAISHREAARRDRLRGRDQRLADLHIKMGTGTKGDVLRHVLGGGPVAKQSQYNNSSNIVTRESSSSPLSTSSSLASLSRSSSADATAAAAAAATTPSPMPIPLQC